MTMTLFSAPALIEFARPLLVRAGVPDANALLVADSLIAANLRGVDSHGFQMLLAYLDQLHAETMDPRADGRPVLETGTCMIYDGQNGIGQVVADRCVGHAARLAQVAGLALVAARESNHFGAAAYWGQKRAAAGCIGIVMTNASPAAPPWQGKEPRIGTNPICMAVPGSESGGWLLDMVTTTVALGKITTPTIARRPPSRRAGLPTPPEFPPPTRRSRCAACRRPWAATKEAASDCWWSFSPRDFPADRWRPMWDRCGTVLNGCA